jgi:hypothetical protein
MNNISLHLFFLKGNVYDYQDVEDIHDSVLKLSNDCSAQTQVNIARQYWLYKDKEVKVAVITNSDFFLKEINTLIMLYYLSEEDRLKVINLYHKEYSLSLFKHNTLNITAFDLELNEACDLNELGFEYKSLDKVIDFQNNVQETVARGLYDL